MASDLNVTDAFIRKIAERSSRYYRHHEIRKKNGGVRLISNPSPVLKTMQYWLSWNIFAQMPVSSAASAYIKGSSIAKNARQHLGKSHILHLDITDFFPSIGERHIKRVLSRNADRLSKVLDFDLSDSDHDLICAFALCNGGLAIGSVSSPIISNVVMYDIDLMLDSIAKRHSCIYSRYADDMVFSSNEFIPTSIVEDVQATVGSDGFSLNPKKQVFMSRKGRMVVTGVNVNGERLTLGRAKRDEIKKMVYAMVRHNIGERARVLGNLNYLKSIDPWYYNVILIKYPDILDLLKSGRAPATHTETP